MSAEETDTAASLDRVEDAAENIFARFEEDNRLAAQLRQEQDPESSEVGPETNVEGAADESKAVSNAQKPSESVTETQDQEGSASSSADKQPQPIDEVLENVNTSNSEPNVEGSQADTNMDESFEADETATSVDKKVTLEGDDIYNVERILDKRAGKRGVFEYLVQWEGNYECTWEPEENMIACGKMLVNFNKNWEKKQERRLAQQKKRASANPRPRPQPMSPDEGPATITTVTASGRKAKRLLTAAVSAGATVGRASPASRASSVQSTAEKKSTLVPKASWKKRLLARSGSENKKETEEDSMNATPGSSKKSTTPGGTRGGGRGGRRGRPARNQLHGVQKPAAATPASAKKKPTQIKLKSFTQSVKNKVVSRLTRQRASSTGDDDADSDGKTSRSQTPKRGRWIDTGVDSPARHSPPPATFIKMNSTTKLTGKKGIGTGTPGSTYQSHWSGHPTVAHRDDIAAYDGHPASADVQEAALDLVTEMETVKVANVHMPNTSFPTAKHPTGGASFLLRPYASSSKSKPSYTHAAALRKGYRSEPCAAVAVKTGLDLFMLTYFNIANAKSTGVADAELLHCGRMMTLLKAREINIYEAANSTNVPLAVLRAWLKHQTDETALPVSDRVKIDGIEMSRAERKNQTLAQIIRHCEMAAEYEQKKLGGHAASPSVSPAPPTSSGPRGSTSYRSIVVGRPKPTPGEPTAFSSAAQPSDSPASTPKQKPKVIARRLPSSGGGGPIQPLKKEPSSSSLVKDRMKVVAGAKPHPIAPPPQMKSAATPSRLPLPPPTKITPESRAMAGADEQPETSGAADDIDYSGQHLRAVKRKPDYARMAGGFDEDESEDFVPEDSSEPKRVKRSFEQFQKMLQPIQKRAQARKRAPAIAAGQPVVRLKLGRWRYTSVAPMLNEVFRIMCRVHQRAAGTDEDRVQALKTWHICEMVNWGNLTVEQAARELDVEETFVENIAMGIAHARKYEAQQIKAAQIPGMSFTISEELNDVQKSPLEYLQERLEPGVHAWSAISVYTPQNAADTLLHVLRYARGQPDLSNLECSYMVSQRRPTVLPFMPPYRIQACTLVYDCRKMNHTPNVLRAGGIGNYLLEGALEVSPGGIQVNHKSWNLFTPGLNVDDSTTPVETTSYVDVNRTEDAYALLPDPDSQWLYCIQSIRSRFADRHHQLVRVLHLVTHRGEPAAVRYAILSYINVRYVQRQTAVPKMKQVADGMEEGDELDQDDEDEQNATVNSGVPENSHVQEIVEDPSAAAASRRPAPTVAFEQQQAVVAGGSAMEDDIETEVIPADALGDVLPDEEEIETEVISPEDDGALVAAQVIHAPPLPSQSTLDMESQQQQQMQPTSTQQDVPQQQPDEPEAEPDFPADVPVAQQEEVVVDDREPNFSLEQPVVVDQQQLQQQPDTDVTNESETLDVIGSPEPRQPISIEHQQEPVFVNGDHDEHEAPSPSGTEPFDEEEEPAHSEEVEAEQVVDQMQEQPIDVSQIVDEAIHQAGGVDVLAAATHHIEQISPSKLPDVGSHAVVVDDGAELISVTDTTDQPPPQAPKNYASMFGSSFDQ